MDNLQRKIHVAVLVVFVSLVGFLFSGCGMEKKKLTSSGYAWEPQMAWNGSHFVIVYFHGPKSIGSAYLNALKVDTKGKVLETKPKLAEVYSYGQPHLLSNLVWNPDNKQFAFAVSANGHDEITVFLLDANLKVIGKPLVFGPLFKTPPLRNYIDLSLTWNAKIKEYAVTYILDKHPYIQVPSQIAVSRFTPQGKVATAGFVFMPFDCLPGCSRTSITSDPETARYVIAFFNGKDAMISFLDNTYQYKSVHKIMSGWQPNSGGDAIKVVFDKESGQYIVAAIKGTELAYQIIDNKGAPVSKVFVKGKGYDELFSLQKLGHGKHNHILGATKKSQVRCWPIYSTGHEKTDLVNFLKPSKHPSLAIVNRFSLYVAWIESDLLYFGHPALDIDIK